MAAVKPDLTRQIALRLDITARTITLQCLGHDEHHISREEALALRDDLLAAVVAANEHRVLRGEDQEVQP